MNSIRDIAIFAVVAIVMMVMAGCPLLSCNNDSSPTAPSPPPPMEGGFTGSTPPPPPPPPTSTPPASTQKAEYSTSKSDTSWIVQMRNTSGWGHLFAAACYLPGDAPLAQQKRVGSGASTVVPDGARATLAAELKCGGLIHQCDFGDCPMPASNPDLGGCVIQAKQVISGPCDIPPPPPPNGCVQPPAPDCAHGPAVWFKDRCEWVCPPPQDACPLPRPDPLCSEQTWLPYPQCIWIGECPKPCELECGFGYELDEAACKCIPLDVCHVSNKGFKDGNWNIQEHQVKFTPGHAKHMDPTKFCPVDYFGQCDGRSLNDPCLGQ